MPKFDWDAFLGGVAKSGLEGYQIASAASTAKGELDRRRTLDAFNMGAATPIIRMGGVGGLGGMAKNQIDQSAGLNPEDPIDYQAYDTPGAIGAAPAAEAATGPVGQASGGGAGPQGQPSGGMGDGASRAAAGGATAQSQSGPVTDEEAAQTFLGRLDADRRKAAIQGVEMADQEKQKKNMSAHVTDLRTALQNYNRIKVGVESADKVIRIRQGQLQQLVGVEQALLDQRSNAPSEQYADIDKQIQKNHLMIDAYKADVVKAQGVKEKAAETADIADSELRRRSHVLELLGVPPHLIQNYWKTYMDDGDLVNAENLILYGMGGGMPGKKPSATQPKAAPRGMPRPLR